MNEPTAEGLGQEEEQCTICLQPFLDRTILPVCAHEFCFECIRLWSEQSRKCPLCSRSFANAYLIHRIRSQYDYQKHYLLPLRSSPPPESRASALRNTRRERQWGRRQRQQREEQDQLERAIARRRWLYQHHLYAKHVASNPYTRYRPFPTPAQFAASQDLISRMTTFLRRELRVWPNLDVEFLTTYTLSLMKAIDIRSEPAVKLLSEFLDLDTPGMRPCHAEHFAHEMYSYLRSPYRDLNVYDQIAQYDMPQGLSPPRVVDMGSRWTADSPPRSRSRSRRPHRESNVRESSAEGDREDRRRSPGSEGRIHPCDRSPSPPPGGISLWEDRSHPPRPDPSPSAVVADASPHCGEDEKGKDASTTDTLKLSVPRDDASAAALTVGNRPSEGTMDGLANVRGSAAKNAQQSRARHRTLSESVQAYLARPATRCPTRQGDGSRPRLMDGPRGPDVGTPLASRQRRSPVECVDGDDGHI